MMVSKGLCRRAAFESSLKTPAHGSQIGLCLAAAKGLGKIDLLDA